MLFHSGTRFCEHPDHKYAQAGPFVQQCEKCEGWLHNADHSDCMVRHLKEVHGVSWLQEAHEC